MTLLSKIQNTSAGIQIPQNYNIGYLPGSIINSNAINTINGISGINGTGIVTLNAAPKTGKLPRISFFDKDENDREVKIEFSPDSSISAFEACQVCQTLLFMAVTTGGSFSLYLWIKENGYERHFKISVV